jgi:hypothetical protein
VAGAPSRVLKVRSSCSSLCVFEGVCRCRGGGRRGKRQKFEGSSIRGLPGFWEGGLSDRVDER